jgi:hypothetical protein
MKSFVQLAQAAYEAYSQRAGGLTFAGDAFPLWADIGVERQACWIEAVKAVAAEIAAIH